MINVLDIAKWLVVLSLAGWALRTFLWRAVLCVAPSTLRIEPDVPAEQMQVPAELRELDRAVRALGFSPLGSRVERPRFTHETVSYDYASPQAQTFATVYLARDKSPRLYYLTPLAGGGFVITANYRRPAREIQGRYVSGGLEGFAPDRVFKAHLKRRESVGTPQGAFDAQARLAAAHAWFKGPGSAEIRLQNVHGLLFSVGTLAMVGAVYFGKG